MWWGCCLVSCCACVELGALMMLWSVNSLTSSPYRLAYVTVSLIVKEDLSGSFVASYLSIRKFRRC